MHLWLGTALRHDHARSKVQKHENFGVVITPKFFTIFVCFHATANQNFRHFSTRRRTAKTAEHSLGVYYPPESSPHLVTQLLLHNKPQYILSAPSCNQSKHPSHSSPDRSSSFAPTEGNIYDTLSAGIRPEYNSLCLVINSTVQCISRATESYCILLIREFPVMELTVSLPLWRSFVVTHSCCTGAHTKQTASTSHLITSTPDLRFSPRRTLRP